MQSTLLKIHPCIGDTTIKKKTVGTSAAYRDKRERDAISFSTGQFYGTSYKAMQARLYYFSGEGNHFI